MFFFVLFRIILFWASTSPVLAPTYPPCKNGRIRAHVVLVGYFCLKEIFLTCIFLWFSKCWIRRSCFLPELNIELTESGIRWSSRKNESDFLIEFLFDFDWKGFLKIDLFWFIDIFIWNDFWYFFDFCLFKFFRFLKIFYIFYVFFERKFFFVFLEGFFWHWLNLKKGKHIFLIFWL